MYHNLLIIKLNVSTMKHASFCNDYAFQLTCPESLMPFLWAFRYLNTPHTFSDIFSQYARACVCIPDYLWLYMHMCLWIWIFWLTSSHAPACICCLCVYTLWLQEPFSQRVSSDLSSVLTQQVLVPSALFSKLSQGVRQEHITAEDGCMLSGLTHGKENVLA